MQKLTFKLYSWELLKKAAQVKYVKIDTFSSELWKTYK